jgi:hypothetical protein
VTSGARPRQIDTIRNLLSIPPSVEPSDFKIDDYISGGELVIEIAYRLDGNVKFRATVAADGSAQLAFTPGDFIPNTTTDVQQWDGVISAVQAWVSRIDDDLKATPSYQMFEVTQGVIADLEERLQKIEDDYVTADRLRDVEGKLDDLQTQIEANLRELYADNKEEQDKRVDELEQEIDFLKASAGGTTMRQFLRTVLPRLARFATNPATQEMLAKGRPFLKRWQLAPVKLEISRSSIGRRKASNVEFGVRLVSTNKKTKEKAMRRL